MSPISLDRSQNIENFSTAFGGIKSFAKNIMGAIGGTSAPVPAPMPEIKNSVTEKKVMETKAIQTVASEEKVTETKAQEAATKKDDSATQEPAPSNTTQNQTNQRSDYNGPNDVSIRGDGWSKELLTYFGVVGSSY
jgi:hypothetical protein